MAIKFRFKRFQFTAPQIVVLSFAALIFVGALLLTFPIATVDGKGLRFLDALFTSTSAVCVTGLVVVDTGTTFTTFGQIVIMLLIQFGGLGIMTISTILIVALGWKVGLRNRLIVQEALNQDTPGGIVRLAKRVVLYTAIVEFTGATILAIRFSRDFGPLKGIYYGIFHAVSAFNNAGFDLIGGFRSLTGYVDDLTVNLTIMGLIVIGGLGFTVLNDLVNYRQERRLHLHSKIVLKTTAFLIVTGALAILSLEITNPGTLGHLTWRGKILGAFFQSVTPRTAGFNTVDIGALLPATQFLIIILMFIGASPNSTGGGIKTSTFALILSSVWSTARGREHVVLSKRTVPRHIVQKGFAITFLAALWVFAVVVFLTLTEKADFLTLLFETVSAFGTVGLSMNETPHLSDLGRVAIALTMYIGRVGPLTLAVALAERKSEQANYKYPEEKIMVG